jgi:hypothetical protein
VGRCCAVSEAGRWAPVGRGGAENSFKGRFLLYYGRLRRA